MRGGRVFCVGLEWRERITGSSMRIFLCGESGVQRHLWWSGGLSGRFFCCYGEVEVVGY